MGKNKENTSYFFCAQVGVGRETFHMFLHTKTMLTNGHIMVETAETRDFYTNCRNEDSRNKSKSDTNGYQNPKFGWLEKWPSHNPQPFRGDLARQNKTKDQRRHTKT